MQHILSFPINTQKRFHTQFLNTFNIGRFIENRYLCDCRNSPFVSEHHDHVITGNLSIVYNETIRGLISKNPIWTVQNKIAWGKEKKVILAAAEGHAKSWAKKGNREVLV